MSSVSPIEQAILTTLRCSDAGDRCTAMGVLPQGYLLRQPGRTSIGCAALDANSDPLLCRCVPSVINCLSHALTYGLPEADVEMTGGHTQFWDKFNFR
jgi:hypothetical protein